MKPFRKLGDDPAVRGLMQWVDDHQWRIWVIGSLDAYRACRFDGMSRTESVHWVWRARPLS